MAVTISGREYFSKGTSGASKVVGYETGTSSPRIARIAFTVDGSGANTIEISTETYHNYQYTTDTPPTLRAAVSTNSTAYANTVSATEGFPLTFNNGTYTGTITGVFVPNVTYYLFIFPAEANYRIRQYLERETITTSGSAGLVYIHNGSTYEAYQCYIHNGTTWEPYIPYIHDGSKWSICS